MRVWYATREDVKNALDSKATAYVNRKVDRAIGAASRTAEGLLHRRYYPQLDTRYFDWPNWDYAPTWRLYLGSNELISLATNGFVSGGTIIPASNYILRRLDADTNPPYTVLDVNLGTNSALSSAASTFQQSIGLTGTYGYRDELDDTAGTLATTVNASVVTVDVTNSAAIGIGSIVNLDTERMQVSARSQLTTGTTITAPLTASNANVLLSVSDGTQYHQDEVITIDGEKMIVRDIASNTVTVQRAWDGSVLATHNSATVVFAPRRMTVVRAVLGSTAAAHTSGIEVYTQSYPEPLVSLVIAYALNQILQEAAGYARVSGSGDNQKEYTGRGIKDLEADAVAAIGRRNRVAAI